MMLNAFKFLVAGYPFLQKEKLSSSLPPSNFFANTPGCIQLDAGSGNQKN